jgi:glyoxylase-like metal-dependent hydrolase (beta-lactamase superfamily II)
MFRTPVALFALLLLVAGLQSAAAQDQYNGAQLVVPDWCRKLPRPQYSQLQRVPVHHGWFEVYRVAPHVTALYEPHQWQETVMYLVEGNRKALLIDTGMGIGDLRALVSELTRLPVIVVNTHTHTDHTGSNWQFGTVWNIDTGYTRKNAGGSNDVREELEPQKLCGSLPDGFDPGTYSSRPWHPSRWLREGDLIDLGGRTLRVLLTPGHAPDAICLFDESAGLLFTGDTYYPGPVYVFGAGSDPIAYQRSVDRLAAFASKVRYVLGGHNVPLAPPAILPELAREFTQVLTGKIPASGEAAEGAAKFIGPQITFFVDPRYVETAAPP